MFAAVEEAGRLASGTEAAVAGYTAALADYTAALADHTAAAVVGGGAGNA